MNSYNTAAEKLQEAEKSGDVKATVGLQALINFHGGGHINHSLFWENLAPKKSGGGEPPKGELGKAIDDSYGSLDDMKKQFNAALAGIQGSGWGWLVKDTQTGKIGIKTYANQDPVVGQYKPLLGIDAWEHSVSMSLVCGLADFGSITFSIRIAKLSISVLSGMSSIGRRWRRGLNRRKSILQHGLRAAGIRI